MSGKNTEKNNKKNHAEKTKENQLRRTKIVATLGPASSQLAEIEGLIKAGANVFRLNFSHGESNEHKTRAQLIREAAKKQGRIVAILGDLQGPKIRIARFKDGRVNLDAGDTFTLHAGLDSNAGDAEQVGIDYPQLVSDCAVGDTLLLDDGRVVLQVQSISDQKVICNVIIGGELSNNKGINCQGGGLTAPALTDKDFSDIAVAAEIGVDYLAVSFPRSAADIELAREKLIAAGGQAGMVAKIERAEVVEDASLLTEIMEASDAIMVARGDLGVEIGDAALVAVQKQMIKQARSMNKMVITATQMMESMIENALPTRAEVFDVANAVIDGTDAVMLSAESAAGKYPTEAVAAMHRIILGAEQYPAVIKSQHRMNEKFMRIDEAIGLSVMYAANHLDGVKAIVCMTESGYTPQIMSRINSDIPILAFARREQTRNRLALCRGVYAIDADKAIESSTETHQWVSEQLLKFGYAADGDLVIFANGKHHQLGGTNNMTIIRIGD
ncbi:MAG: pyruvate kinase [Cellvibrionales bacterium]|nr:pyruvate kinase [Cellvibrionales bacterium]